MNAVEQAELFTDAARTDTEAVEAKLGSLLRVSCVATDGDAVGDGDGDAGGRAGAGCYAGCIADHDRVERGGEKEDERRSGSIT